MREGRESADVTEPDTMRDAAELKALARCYSSIRSLERWIISAVDSSLIYSDRTWHRVDVAAKMLRNTYFPPVFVEVQTTVNTRRLSVCLGWGMSMTCRLEAKLQEMRCSRETPHRLVC